MTPPRFVLAAPKINGGHSASSMQRAMHKISDPKNALQPCLSLWSNGSETPPSRSPRELTIVGQINPKTDLMARVSHGLGEARSGTGQDTDLFSAFWGSYVAIRSDPAAGLLEILRDPSGGMPAYFTETKTHFLVGSDLAALDAAGAQTRLVSWDALYEHLAAPEVRRKRTCLAGISELAPGGALHIGTDEIGEDQLWSPWDYIEGRRQETVPVHPAALREIICHSISAMAAPFRNILIAVSGGLDSSILCAALAREECNFTCLTLATEDPSGDERRFAATVAQATGADLKSFIYDPTLIDLRRSSSAHLPRPVGKPFMQEVERAYSQLVESQRFDAIFTGNGGDNVFCFLHSAAPIVDRFRSEGLGRGVAQTLIDACRITDCDLVTMTRAALRLLLRGPRAGRLDLSLLHPERSTESQSPRLTPHLDNPPSRLPGKIGHVDLLMKIQNFVEGLERTNSSQVICPLLCQPIVEACLAVPAWKWSEHGVNRNFARQAFRDLLPESILTRVSKAGPDSVMAAVYQQNRETLRDQLLGGLLRKNRILDAPATEAALSSSDTVRNHAFHRLLAFGEAEAWARSRSR